MIWGLFDKKKSAPQEAEAERKGLFKGLRKSSSKLAESFTAVFTKDKLDAAALQYSYFGLLASLGYAHADHGSRRKASTYFTAVTEGIDALPAAASRASIAAKPRQSAATRAAPSTYCHHSPQLRMKT